MTNVELTARSNDTAGRAPPENGESMRTTRFTAWRKFSCSVTATSGVAVLLAILQSPASAAETNDRHCVGEASSFAATAKPPTCFATFSEAISFATNGTVKLPANANTVSQSQLDLGAAASRTALATVVLGISYTDTGFRGNTYTHLAGSGCDDNDDIDWYFQFPTDWNDQAGSARAYNKCLGFYYEDGDGTSGSGATVTTDWSGGALNNRATFIEWI